MNVRDALARSPIKQAVRDEGNGLRVVVTRLKSGHYDVVVTAGETIYLTETVFDEQAVENILWERLRISSILFEPVQPPALSPSSQKQKPVTSVWSRLLSLFNRLCC